MKKTFWYCNSVFKYFVQIVHIIYSLGVKLKNKIIFFTISMRQIYKTCSFNVLTIKKLVLINWLFLFTYYKLVGILRMFLSGLTQWSIFVAFNLIITLFYFNVFFMCHDLILNHIVANNAHVKHKIGDHVLQILLCVYIYKLFKF